MLHVNFFDVLPYEIRSPLLISSGQCFTFCATLYVTDGNHYTLKNRNS